jgi:dihydropteroate synthase
LRFYPLSLESKETVALMKKIKVSDAGLSIMKNKMHNISFFVKDLPAIGANVLKQQLLSLGGEAALPENCVKCEAKKNVDLIFSIRKDKLPILISKLKQQWWQLPKLAEFLDKNLSSYSPWFNFNGLDLRSSKPLVMGILNMTPDSFSDGGQYNSLKDAVSRAEKMVENGVDIFDVGGESTRPGAKSVDVKTEIDRTIPLIKELIKEFPKIPISIDTTKFEVANLALSEGAKLVNDISGLNFDEKIAKIVAKFNASIVLMHIKGTPRTMQQNPQYDNVINEILDFLDNSIDIALKYGVDENKIIIDPGIGFGKTVEQNLYILKHLDSFFALNKPVLIGLSKKSFIGAVLNEPQTKKRLSGTIAMNTLALMKGAGIIRVHDVKEAVDLTKMIYAVKEIECF